MATKKNEAYIEFKANTSEFQKGIKAMNTELKTASNELRLNSTQLKGAGDSTELLSERQDILQRELEASTQKVDLTERSLAECEATLGKNSKEYETLNNAVLAAKNQQAAIQNELDQTAAKLSKLEAGSKQTATAFEKLGNEVEEQENDLSALKRKYADVVLEQGKNSKEAKKLAKEIDNLSGDLKENKQKLNEAEAAAESLDKSYEDLGNSASDAGGKLDKIKSVAGGIGGAVAGAGAAVTGAVGGFLALGESTREARNEMAKLETGFEMAGLTATDAQNTFSELYGILGDEGAAVEAGQQLAKISKNEKDLEANTRILTGVMGVYGTSIPTEGLAEGMAATAAMGSVQGVLADALEWQGVNLDDYNAKLETMSTEEERAAYIQKTLTDLYGESADAYRENNAEIIEANKAQADLNNTINEIGAIAEPIMTSIKQLANDLLGSITPFVSLIGEGLTGALNGTEGAADKLAEGLSGIISTGLKKIVEMLPTVIQTISALIPKILSSILQQLPTILKTIISMVSQVASSLGDIFPVLIPEIVNCVIMLAETLLDNIDLIIDAAISLILGLADGLISATPLLIDKIPVIIEKLLTAVTSNLPKLLEMGIKLTIQLSLGLVKAIPQLVSKIPQILKAIIQAIIAGIGSIVETGVKIVSSLGEGILERAGSLREKVADIFSSIKEKMLAPIKNAKENVVNTIQSLHTSFVDKVEAIKNKAANIFDTLKKKITKPVEDARKTISGVVEKLKTIFNFSWSLPKLKIPKISVSGGKAPYGIAGKGKLPSFSIQWHAKGGVFTEPTVLHGFGEAGTEYALPLNERSLAPLASMLNKLTISGDNGLADVLASRFDSAVDRLAARLEALESHIYIDGREVAAATASYNDIQSGTRSQLAERGVALR